MIHDTPLASGLSRADPQQLSRPGHRLPTAPPLPPQHLHPGRYGMASRPKSGPSVETGSAVCTRGHESACYSQKEVPWGELGGPRRSGNCRRAGGTTDQGGGRPSSCGWHFPRFQRKGLRGPWNGLSSSLSPDHLTPLPARLNLNPYSRATFLCSVC